MSYIAFSGLTASGSSIDMTNAGSNTKIYIDHGLWDNVTPFTVFSGPNNGGATITVLEHNIYPNGSCPVLSTYGNRASDRFSKTYAAACPNYQQDAAANSFEFGISALGVGNSPSLCLDSSYQNSGIPTYALNRACWQVVQAAGTNGAWTMGLANSGSTGDGTLDLATAGSGTITQVKANAITIPGAASEATSSQMERDRARQQAAAGQQSCSETVAGPLRQLTEPTKRG